jgi:UDP-N-acetylmuramoylalanine--D-glutamate ligase
MAAFAATADHVSPEAVRNVATEFGGVEHRIELVRELGGVKYYNSSIDSTPTRTAAALAAFKEKVIVICGGYDKNLSYEPLAVTLCEKTKAMVLTGASSDKIMTALEGYEGYKTSGLLVYRESIFESAVNKTRELAEKGDTVILSPAAASFDAFDNFMVRGNTFKKIVNSFENI